MNDNFTILRRPAFSVIAAWVLTTAYPLPAQPTPPPVTPPVTASTSPSPFVVSNYNFTVELFRQASPDSSQNAFFSPTSIATALAMTGYGANGDTAAQMAKVLHYPAFSPALLTNYASFQKILALAQTASGSQLNVANSLWPEINPEHPLLPAYLNLVQTNFAAAIVPVDYIKYADAARLQINHWVEDKTNAKIKDLLHAGDVDATTRLVLVNAIYFKGNWAEAFRPQSTQKGNFTHNDGSTSPILLMVNTLTTRYADIPDGPVPCQILSLAYAAPPAPGMADLELSPKNPGLTFAVILPRAPDGLAALEKSLTGNQLYQLLDRLSPTYASVQVFLPRFKLDQRFDLGVNLQSLGMTNAFVSGRADFSGMTGNRDLYISKVIHQAFVAVDETGTEAAAATAIVAAPPTAAAGPPPSPPIFRADHPFLFLIRENSTGSILFLGRLANPPAPLAEEISVLDAMAVSRGPRNGARTSGNPPPVPITGNIPANPTPPLIPVPPTQ